MRALLLIPFLCLAACTGPRITHLRYSPPSSAPVRAAIGHAQDAARQAKKDIADARKARDDALALALSDADTQIDKLTVELVTAQTALNDLEAKTATQTDQLNHAVEDKNTALLERDAADEKVHKASSKLWHTRILLLAALIWIFRTPLLALGKMLTAGI